MKVTRKELEGHFEDARMYPNQVLQYSDARLGKLVAIAVKSDSGGISIKTDFYTYGEMVAFLTGLRKTKETL